MKASIIAAAAALLSVASAQYGNETTPSVTYTTEIVTAYETYCPYATEIVHGEMTYTVTEATTLTITNCPCTVSYPVTTSTVTSCTSCATAAPAPYTNATTPVASPTYAASSSLVTEAPVATFTGAANRVAGAGAGLAGLLGLAAFVL